MSAFVPHELSETLNFHFYFYFDRQPRMDITLCVFTGLFDLPEICCKFIRPETYEALFLSSLCKVANNV